MEIFVVSGTGSRSTCLKVTFLVLEFLVLDEIKMYKGHLDPPRALEPHS